MKGYICRWIRWGDKRVPGGTRGYVVSGRKPVEELMQGLRPSTCSCVQTSLANKTTT